MAARHEPLEIPAKAPGPGTAAEDDPGSAIQYLVPPKPEYPRLSRRNGESGPVIVRAFADEAGLPHQVRVERSSGFARLDEAAMSAVCKTRFKPAPKTANPGPVGFACPFLSSSRSES